jgi:hypothetical protein
MDAHEPAEAKTEQHGRADTDGCVEESRTTHPKHFTETHAEAESDDGSLQQKLRESLNIGGIGSHARKAEQQSGCKCNWRRQKTTRRKDKSNEKYVLPHSDTSVRHQCLFCPSSNYDWQSENLIAASKAAPELV